MTKPNLSRDIEDKAAEALKLLSDASSKQLALIAEAALNATRLLAVQAAEAEKVKNIKGADDHDFWLTFSAETKIRLEAISSDIKELKDGTETRISTLETEKLNIRDSYPVLYKVGIEKSIQDHEDRIRVNTGRITQIMTWGSAAIVVLGIAEFILNLLIK